MYQRSRTISGPEAPFTSNLTDRVAVNQLRKQRHKLMTVLLLFIISSCVIVFLLTQMTINMSVITPSARSAKGADTYIALLDDYFEDQPLERLLFLTNYESLNGYFARLAPEVKSIRLESDGIASAKVKLIFREPVMTWSVGGKKYYVDSDGVIFERNYFDEPEVAVDDQSGIPTTPGQEVVNKPFMSFLGQSVSKFRQKGFVVSGVILPIDTVRQAVFSLSERSYSVRMTLDRGVDSQVDQAVEAISFFDNRGSTPEYIDVRVDQRVFYK